MEEPTMWITTEEAAARLDRSRRTVRAWRLEGRPLLLEVGPLGDLMEGTAAGVVAIAVVRYFVEGSDAGPPKMCWCSSAVISLIKRVRFVFSRSSALTSW